MANATPLPHGTESGYSHHKCRCDLCRTAVTAAMKRRRERARAKAVDPSSYEHATFKAYNYYKCRCDDCVQYVRDYQKRTYRDTPGKAQKASDAVKRRRATDPVAFRKKKRDYRVENRDSFLVYKQVRRVRETASVVPFTAEQLQQRMLYFGGRCYLQLPGVCTGEAEQIDHVKPVSKGGSHMLANLRPACKACNLSKAAKWPFFATIR